MLSASRMVGKRLAFMEPSLVWISVVGVGKESVVDIRAVTVKRKRTCIGQQRCGTVEQFELALRHPDFELKDFPLEAAPLRSTSLII